MSIKQWKIFKHSNFYISINWNVIINDKPLYLDLIKCKLLRKSLCHVLKFAVTCISLTKRAGDWLVRIRACEQIPTEVCGCNGFNTCEGRSFRANNNPRVPKQSWKFMMRIKSVDRKRTAPRCRHNRVAGKDPSCAVFKIEILWKFWLHLINWNHHNLR